MSRALKRVQYKGFALNENYAYDPLQLPKILNLLYQARVTYKRPYVCHIQIGIDLDAFQPRTIRELLRSQLKKYLYFWTLEYTFRKKYHIHLMVAFDRSDHYHHQVPFFLRSALKSLTGVSGVFAPSRKGMDSEWLHDLKTEFDDAVLRYCYMAKVEQKKAIKCRSFGSSKTYFSIPYRHEISMELLKSTR